MDLIANFSSHQARNQLRTPGGAKIFLRRAQNFELCPIILNYVQHIFPGGAKIFQGGFAPLRTPLVTGLVRQREIGIQSDVSVVYFSGSFR